jgi:hypothetical protein
VGTLGKWSHRRGPETAEPPRSKISRVVAPLTGLSGRYGRSLIALSRKPWEMGLTSTRVCGKYRTRGANSWEKPWENDLNFFPGARLRRTAVQELNLFWVERGTGLEPATSTLGSPTSRAGVFPLFSPIRPVNSPRNPSRADAPDATRLSEMTGSESACRRSRRPGYNRLTQPFLLPVQDSILVSRPVGTATPPCNDLPHTQV